MNNSLSPLTYKDAGVDIDAGDQLVENIKPFAKRTMRPEVLGGIGGFGALVEVSKKFKNPVMVSGTDGVGTKLKLAFHLNKHDTVGQDLVAMSVNDILVQGAEPIFFLDYFACGKLDVAVATDVVKGIAYGCELAGCALIGGETAEMPSMYPEGEYDLAGFAVGVVEKENIIDGSKIKDGDVLIGVASSGLHSNGFSLVRKALLDVGALKLDTWVESLGDILGNALLRPTRIYVRSVRRAISIGGVHGLSHITGGGLPGNLPRCLPDGLCIEVRESSWKVPPIFDLIAERGNIELSEMRRVFNLGVGLVAFVDPSMEQAVLEALRSENEVAWPMGRVCKATSSREEVTFIP